MAVLTGKQVAAYARGAGFKQPALSVMVAVAFVESSFKTDARNPNSTATGLWQILASHKQFAGWDLTDPAVNAKAAKKLWDDAGGTSGGLKPWASSQSGWTKKENVAMGIKAATAVEDPSKLGSIADVITDKTGNIIGGLVPDKIEDAAGAAANAAGATTDAVKSIGGAINWVSQPGNLQRVAYVWLGGILVVVGIALVAAPVAKPVASTIANVIPIGRIGKLASAATAVRK